MCRKKRLLCAKGGLGQARVRRVTGALGQVTFCARRPSIRILVIVVFNKILTAFVVL